MSFSLHSQFDLTGRVVLITGAANILGPEFAAALAEFGAQLVLVDINEDECSHVAQKIVETYGIRAISITADVSDEQAVVVMVKQVLTAFGRIDTLINAAATKTLNYFKSLMEYNLEDWNQVMSVNLTGMFLCTKHVVPHFVERNQGNIINIASIYGMVGPDPRIYEGSWYLGQPINTPPVYAASKGGVINFTRYLATTLASHNIRANCITPGGVFSGQNETFIGRYSARVPLGRMARREELRGAVLFLASDASSYVTGHNLVVDGGLTAW
jgi:NAD(P)-dependent dehydrogenase (short-subunit alcohol dehydrogenase family)